MDKNKAKTPHSMFISIVFTPVGHNEEVGGIIGLYTEEIFLK